MPRSGKEVGLRRTTGFARWLLLLLGLLVVRHTLQTSQDHEHDHGQQRREDGAHQVVAAAVLADVHQLGDGPADHIHPRDGGREEETR